MDYRRQGTWFRIAQLLGRLYLDVYKRQDPALRNVLAGSALLYGGLKDVSTFYQHAMINHSYIEGGAGPPVPTSATP